MKRLSASLMAAIVATSLVLSGCTQATPAPSPTQVSAASKAAEPTKAPAAVPASAQASASPATAVPAKKVDFPQKGKSINLIVPFSAGGATDVGARLLAPLLEKELNTPVQVVNKPDAGGQAGYMDLANAKPDGYTLGYAVLPSTISLYLDPERKAAFNRKSFIPLALHVIDPDVAAVKDDSPFKTMKDLIDAAKAKPGSIKVAVSAILGPSHLDMLQTQKLTGTEFALVNFDGGAPGTTALLGNHVDAKWGNIGDFMPTIRGSGGIRVLGVMDKEQSKFLPGVKTFEEQGIKQYSATSRGLALPAGTPQDIVDTLSAAVKKAMTNPDHQKKMEEMGVSVRYMDPTQFGAYWDEVEVPLKPIIDSIKR
jgi:tripartite-type tricarboxylate transporter receptor subunit TctC